MLEREPNPEAQDSHSYVQLMYEQATDLDDVERLREPLGESYFPVEALRSYRNRMQNETRDSTQSE